MIETLHGGAESYSRTELCRALGVSRSGLYDHRAKAQRPRRLQDKELAKEIELLFSQSRRTYGARRLQRMLRRKAIRCGRNRLVRLMRELGLQAVQKRRFRPKTTQSSHQVAIAPNRLNQLLEPPSAPNQVWCAESNLKTPCFLQPNDQTYTSTCPHFRSQITRHVEHEDEHVHEE